MGRPAQTTAAPGSIARLLPAWRSASCTSTQGELRLPEPQASRRSSCQARLAIKQCRYFALDVRLRSSADDSVIALRKLVDRRQPLAWAAHGLALWDVLTTPEAPSSLAARLRVTEVWSCVDIPAGTASRLLCLSGKVLGCGWPGCSGMWGEQLCCATSCRR
jgi:hypothetical protein